VADTHGELIALLRLDGTPLPSILIATNKAWTAARTRKPSREVGQSVRDPQTGFDPAYYGDPRYIGWGGGVPVVIDGAGGRRGRGQRPAGAGGHGTRPTPALRRSLSMPSDPRSSA